MSFLNEVKRSIIGQDMGKINFPYLRKLKKYVGSRGVRTQNLWHLKRSVLPLRHDTL